jgi:hypothetical protein
MASLTDSQTLTVTSERRGGDNKLLKCHSSGCSHMAHPACEGLTPEEEEQLAEEKRFHLNKCARPHASPTSPNLTKPHACVCREYFCPLCREVLHWVLDQFVQQDTLQLFALPVTEVRPSPPLVLDTMPTR